MTLLIWITCFCSTEKLFCCGQTQRWQPRSCRRHKVFDRSTKRKKIFELFSTWGERMIRSVGFGSGHPDPVRSSESLKASRALAEISEFCKTERNRVAKPSFRRWVSSLGFRRRVRDFWRRLDRKFGRDGWSDASQKVLEILESILKYIFVTILPIGIRIIYKLENLILNYSKKVYFIIIIFYQTLKFRNNHVQATF